MQMPISNNDEQTQSAEQSLPVKHETDDTIRAADDDASDDDMSEITRRINLLGKLVIPPSPPSPS